MNPQQQAFVHAYLTTAKGNATEAAKLAGYSEKTAPQIGSRLLKHPEVRSAVLFRLDKADIRTDAILKRLGRIAHSEPESVTGSDVIGASKLILQVNGALKDKASDSRITVNIGFLQPATAPVTVASAVSVTDGEGRDVTAVVLPPQAQAALVSGERACGVPAADSNHKPAYATHKESEGQ